MSTYKFFKTDKEAEETGAWVDMPDGSRWKLRRASSIESQTARTKAEMPYKTTLMRSDRLGIEVPQEIILRMSIEHLALGIVVDWQGVTGPEGEALPCTPANVRKVLEDLPDLRILVTEACAKFSTYHEVEMEAASGNSGSAAATP